MEDKQPRKKPLVPPAPVPEFKKPPAGVKSPTKFTVKNMAYWKSKAGVDLTKKPVGPRATPKPFDREKFEEETRIMQGMENVRAELFSDKSTHDKVKKNLKKKDQDFGFVNYEDSSDPDKN